MYISVVVPVYNLNSILSDALQSLVAQTFRDFEIIVVDDCSNDGSAALAENVLKVANVDYTIIRHEHNRGVSAARNTGLRAARGKYVIFFDGDDLAEPDFVERLYERISKHDGDVTFCGYKTREKSSGIEKMFPSLDSSASMTSDELLRARLLNKVVAMFWAAIYRREFLLNNDIVLTEGRIAGEDVEFVTKVIASGARASFIKDCLYIYMQHEGMGTRKSKSSRDAEIKRYLHHTEAHFDEAEFIMKHMNSRTARHFAEDYIIPIGYQRMFAVYAARNSRDDFARLLRNEKARNALKRSYRSFFDKPEVFMKSLFLIFFPCLYYRKYYNRFNRNANEV